MYSTYGTGWLFLCHPPRPLSNKMKKLMLVTLLKLCFPYLKIHHVPSQLAVRFTFHVWLLKNGSISGRRQFLNSLWPPSFQETRLQLCVNMRKFATKCFGLKTTPTLSDICSKEHKNSALFAHTVEPVYTVRRTGKVAWHLVYLTCVGVTGLDRFACANPCREGSSRTAGGGSCTCWVNLKSLKCTAGSKLPRLHTVMYKRWSAGGGVGTLVHSTERVAPYRAFWASWMPGAADRAGTHLLMAWHEITFTEDAPT